MAEIDIITTEYSREFYKVCHVLFGNKLIQFKKKTIFRDFLGAYVLKHCNYFLITALEHL